MSTDHNTLASLENQAFSLMARLHVILRRQTGRVTDIEYMRIDPVYCRYVLNMALGTQNDDLPQICEKLQEVYFGPEGLFVRTAPKPPLVQRLSGASGASPENPTPSSAHTETPTESETKESIERHHIELNEAVDKGYIGRLR